MKSRPILVIATLTFMPGCEQSSSGLAACEVPLPAPGSNEVLRTVVEVADDLEVVIADVYIPPNVKIPRHYHPGEEIIYVLAGSAVQVEEGKSDRLLQAGDAYVIPREVVHEPYGGPDGGRAIVFRLHVEGMEERCPVPDE